MLNNTKPNDYRETPNVQTGEEIPQQTAPRQPQEEEEEEGSCMQLEQVMMENGEHKDLQIGSENFYHILEPKAEDDEDNAARCTRNIIMYKKWMHAYYEV